MTSSEIRQSFLDFFKSKEHEIVSSSPLVLPADPTLLFANAGMNQFKDIFLGVRQSASKRIANTQKCIRVSGKHNDLEEVGIDTYHHTFFEMLGNWSFGDYYKQEAIAWAWELLTDVWNLPKDRLWATVYRDDGEAESLWKEITDIDPSHVLRFDEKDNFWEMGETGPCGPCSEIHIDLTADGCTPDMINSGVPEVMELWNLVFIQYNRGKDGLLEELPSKHVDTGMGFERLVAVLQGKKSNYDTDLFTPLIEKIRDITGRAYEGDDAVGMRVIADHLRALSFAIADGILPSNEGRGYVLRRLLRRAVRYGRRLGMKGPIMSELFPVLDAKMGDAFPELHQNRERILRAMQAEEESFATTLDRGIALFDEVAESLEQNKKTVFPGATAFKLYDTFGFPLDLTELMASESGLTVNRGEFDALMDQQRERARQDRKSAVFDADMEVASNLAVKGVRSEFRGYEAVELESEASSVLSDGGLCDRISEGMTGKVVLNETPFYAESGGQLGDSGIIRGPNGEFEVTDTQRPAEGIIMHIGRVIKGSIAGGDRVEAIVDSRRRRHIAAHHTATHLLNAALREHVSASVKQAGSLVAPDRLRFDVTYYEAIPPHKLDEIERLVNEWIMENLEVRTYDKPFKEIPGSDIVAVFDEKYGDIVRVVDIGGFSKELCGGTHVSMTGQLGMFRIAGESSVAAGIRRIEAVCGWPAYEWTRHEHGMVRSLARKFSAPPEELPVRVDDLIRQNRRIEKELKHKSHESLKEISADLMDRKIQVEGVNLIAEKFENLDMNGLRDMLDMLRPRMESGIIVLGSANEGKAGFVVSITKDLVEKGLHAGKLIKQVAAIAGGGGGGQPQMAQAGGKQPDKVPDAVKQAPEIVRSMLG